MHALYFVIIVIIVARGLVSYPDTPGAIHDFIYILTIIYVKFKVVASNKFREFVASYTTFTPDSWVLSVAS